MGSLWTKLDPDYTSLTATNNAQCALQDPDPFRREGNPQIPSRAVGTANTPSSPNR